jgi:Ca2+-binding RTX toxin-like protein
VLSVATCALSTPVVAAAEDGSVTVLNSDDRGGGLGVIGTSLADVVNVGLNDDIYRISSQAGLVSDDCVIVSSASVECLRFSGRFVAGMRDGDDILRLRGDAAGWVLRGGYGDDRFYGGPARNGIDGDPGDDLIRGRRGDDRIFGDGGRDRLAGGAGGDRLDALDGRRDLSVNCGSGRDIAVVDRNLDPVPRHCEVVKRLAD